jgi:hypothetical protein
VLSFPAQVTLSPARLSATADTDIYIVADVEFSSCAGSSRSSIVFEWAQLATDDGNKAPVSSAFDFSSVTSSTMHIPPYTLAAGRSYRLSLTLIPSDNPARYTRATYDFSVTALPLVASIQGGDLLRVGIDSDIVLDGSLSSDPNIDASLDQGLTYRWSCILDDGVLPQACLDKDGNTDFQIVSSKAVTIPKGILEPSPSDSMPYTFILQVSKIGRYLLTKAVVCACFCLYVQFGSLSTGRSVGLYVFTQHLLVSL